MRAARSRGFTYLGVLFLMSLLALTAAMASVVWSTVQRRENERELVFVGQQFQAAIERYRQRSKGPGAPYPRRLEDLLRDARAVQVRRDLRRLYIDPMTNRAQWGLIRLADGGIVGVHSLSDRAPFPRSVVAAGVGFPLATSYRDWRFVAPSAQALLASGAPSAEPAPVSPPAAASPPAAGGPAPLAPAPGPEESPPVDESGEAPRPSPQDYRTRTPEACGRIAAHDGQACRDHAARFGADAELECQDSALKRSLACALGEAGALPPLTRRQP